MSIYVSRFNGQKISAGLIFSVVFSVLVSPFALAEKVDKSDLTEIASAPQAQRIKADIQILVGFGTRHTLSETKSKTRGIGAARRWIKSEFESISQDCGGCLQVSTMSDVIENQKRIPTATEIQNVLAILPGTGDANRYVVMSGDIDSRVSDVMDAVSDSPGANDNASGMAGVLEAARVLSQYRFDASIIFVGLSGEEQGLFGGKIMAEKAQANGWQIEAVLNNDMIGNISGINGVTDNAVVRVFSEATRPKETAAEARIRRFTGGEVDSPSRNVSRYIDRLADDYFNTLDVMMIYRLDRFGRGGHHRPFNDVGYPAVRIMETNEHYDRQHQDLRVEAGKSYGDVIEGVDFSYAAKVTGLNAVALAAMAAAPAPPTEVTIKGAVSADTTLSWKQVTGAVAYKVYWRLTTDSQWRYSRDAGDATQYTLKNVVIDNYLFGVASVNAQGIESPVVFPGPLGSFQYTVDSAI